jgi:hypothetical protein
MVEEEEEQNKRSKTRNYIPYKLNYNFACGSVWV